MITYIQFAKSFLSYSGMYFLSDIVFTEVLIWPDLHSLSPSPFLSLSSSLPLSYPPLIQPLLCTWHLSDKCS